MAADQQKESLDELLLPFERIRSRTLGEPMVLAEVRRDFPISHDISGEHGRRRPRIGKLRHELLHESGGGVKCPIGPGTLRWWATGVRLPRVEDDHVAGADHVSPSSVSGRGKTLFSEGDEVLLVGVWAERELHECGSENLYTAQVRRPPHLSVAG
jgi:hypothetical protein